MEPHPTDTGKIYNMIFKDDVTMSEKKVILVEEPAAKLAENGGIYIYQNII